MQNQNQHGRILINRKSRGYEQREGTEGCPVFYCGYNVINGLSDTVPSCSLGLHSRQQRQIVAMNDFSIRNMPQSGRDLIRAAALNATNLI